MVCFTVYHAVNGFTFASCILLGIKASTANLFSKQHYLVAVSRVRKYAFPLANATKNSVLATRIS